MDYYFDQDWSKLAKEYSGLFSIFTAFSRDQEDKIYVQHVIENLKSYIGDLIVNQDAFVYIAGNAKQMPDQVKDALIEAILSIDDDGDKQGATAFLNQMSKEKRLQMENPDNNLKVDVEALASKIVLKKVYCIYVTTDSPFEIHCLDW